MAEPFANGRDGDNLAGRGTAMQLARSTGLSLQTVESSEFEESETTFDLRDLFTLIFKRKWTILSIFVVFVLFSLVMNFLATPIYRASTTIQIDRAPARIVETRDLTQSDTSGEAYEDFIQTQIEILRSRSLAERTIDDIGLKKKDVAKPPSVTKSEAEPIVAREGVRGMVGHFLNQFRSAHPTIEVNADTRRSMATIDAFQGSMNVDMVRKSRLIRVAFDSTDPFFAAKAANGVAQAFLAMNIERRFEASAFAKNYVEEKLLQTKSKLEDSERELVEFSRDQEIINIDEKQSIFSQTLQEYNSAFAKAEQERIRAEVYYRQLQADPYAQQLLSENKQLLVLKGTRAKLETDYQDNLKIYKPAYPKMIQIQAQIAEVDSQIRRELDEVLRIANSSYQSALRAEALMREKFNQAKAQQLDLQGRSIRYGILKREVDTNRQLYDGLLQRYKEIGLTGGVGANNIAIVDKADIPLAPFAPNLRNSLMTGAILGLILGMIVAWLLEYLDDSIKHADDVERIFSVPVLGIIPKVKGNEGKRSRSIALDVLEEPTSMLAEAYRSVRTGLQFSTAHGAPHRLVLTSASNGEGKSTTALALAINFAQMGKAVLLIDADLRHPSIHRLLGLQNDYGLSNYLSSDVSDSEVTVETSIPNLYVMTSGPMPPNPVELLSGMRFLSLMTDAGERFAHIIVDAPPVLGISDAIVLCNQVDNAVFVIESGRTRKAHIKAALKRLRHAGVHPLGVILTKVTSFGEIFGYANGYYAYGRRPATTTSPGRAV